MPRKEIIIKRAKSRKKNSLLFALTIIMISFAVYFASQTTPVKKKYIYPYPHQNLVLLYSKANGISPSLAASVIVNESRFRDDAVSNRGAVGLMQVMPDTGEWIAGVLDEDFSVEKLRDPETNIRYGTWYLAHLLQEFHGNQILALAAYNAGRGTVHGWIDEYGWPADFNDAGAIPYPETRLYVARVIKDRKNYEKLYAPSGK